MPQGPPQKRQKTLVPGEAGGGAEEDLVQDGWTDLSRRIREKMKTIPPGQMSPQAMLAAFEDSDFEKMEEIRARVDSIVGDRQTAQNLKAWYRQLCKRPCFHDAYLQAFNEPSTRLIDTDGKGVERITETGVVVAGVEYPVDCIIYASGFEVGTDYTRRTGFDLTGNNPGQENIRGGLSTIEEKSLGAIAKGGTRPIRGVLAIAEEPAQAGLHVMDAPAFSPESLTGFAASGANLMLFTTGAGNSFCNALSPTIKISVRPDTVAALAHQIDFDGTAVLAGQERIPEAGRRLLDLVRDTASGALTWGEVLDEGDETFIRTGGSL